MLKQLNPRTAERHRTCHLDPDIRRDVRLNPPENWQPAFGQIGSSQSYLQRKGVKEGDLFLFFGWFREVDENFHFVRGKPDRHVIYGYLQVGSIEKSEEIKKYDWHPHAAEHRRSEETNALYLARDTLTEDFSDETKPGSGALEYRGDRVLTKEGQPSRSVWKDDIPAIRPSNIDSEWAERFKGNRICYNWRWQEMVLKEGDVSNDWVKSILR